MKEKHTLFWGIVCVCVLITSAASTPNSQTKKCPDVKGDWFLDGKKLEITSTRKCEIEGEFYGKDSSLSFNAKWNKKKLVYEYKGVEVNFSYKCHIRMYGELMVEDNSLKTTLMDITTACPLSSELKNPVVWKRKAN